MVFEGAMSKRVQITHYTIPQSGTVSDVMENKGSVSVGLIVSVPTSCTAFLALSHTVNSGDFARRTFNYSNPAPLASWNVGSGRIARDLTEQLGVFPYFRLETSVPMTAVASLALVVKY